MMTCPVAGCFRKADTDMARTLLLPSWRYCFSRPPPIRRLPPAATITAARAGLLTKCDRCWLSSPFLSPKAARKSMIFAMMPGIPIGRKGTVSNAIGRWSGAKRLETVPCFGAYCRKFKQWREPLLYAFARQDENGPHHRKDQPAACRCPGAHVRRHRHAVQACSGAPAADWW